MYDRRRRIGAEAVDLLLEILELRTPLLSGAAAELRPRPAESLIAAGLLVPHDHEAGTASLADHDDVPVSLTWSEQARSLAYFSPAMGLIAVPAERLVRHGADMPAILGAVAAELDLARAPPAAVLIDGFLWEMGDARVGKRPARVSLWFARRLSDPSIQCQVVDVARARPLTRPRVVLTTSRAAAIRDTAVPGAVVMALRDVLVAVDDLSVDAEILDARMRGAAPRIRGPLVLSPDGTQLTVPGGPPIGFKSEPMIAAIRTLVAAFEAGERVPIAKLTTHGSLPRLFGKKRWALLSPYINSVNGLWGFDL